MLKKVVPQHMLPPTLWNLPSPSDWRELLQQDFDDLDSSWRAGTAIAQHPLAVMPTQQTSLIDARRTQNIEIMLRRIPGDTTEEKTSFVLHIMHQILCMRCVCVRMYVSVRSESEPKREGP